MKKIIILALTILCLFSVGCNREGGNSSESKIRIYGTVTALGEPVPDCSIEVRQFGAGATYSNTITGMDGTYEVSFVPRDLNIDAFGADVVVEVSLYGQSLKTKRLDHIQPGSSLHCDFDISEYFY